MEITGELHGLREALEDLARVGASGRRANADALTEISLLGHREAVRNAPRSPTQAILNSLRKTKRRRSRNPRAFSRPSPGGLERSISREVVTTADGAQAVIFVAANAEAGRYAGRIHDEKGRTWRNRGPGTVVKGPRADDLFIDRAVKDNAGRFTEIVKAKHRALGNYELN